MKRLLRRSLHRLPVVSIGHAAQVLRATVWLVPAVFVAAAVLLAVALIEADTLTDPSHSVLLFPGPPAGARSFLSAIVQAMISFTGVVFSITIVVLQLSSSQFSPRVLRNFMRDRTIQFSLGSFVATFVYAMVVLRAVQGGSGSGSAFVPRIAVTGAFVLVIVSVGWFIAYIGHVANMIRVATIIAGIGEETRKTLARHDCGAPARDDDAPPPAAAAPIPAPRPGVVVSVNTASLVSLAAEADCLLRLSARVGDYLPEGVPLLEVYGQPGVDGREREDWRAALCRQIAFDTERSMEQDVAFGFRQLADIALQALSPSVNAPTTATQAIDVMHDLLRRIVTTPPPAGHYLDAEGRLRLVVPQHGIADYLELAVGEIWHYGADAPQVPGRVQGMLDDLLTVARPEQRPELLAWRRRIGQRPARLA